MRGTQFVASTLTASPIVLEPCCSLKAPRNVRARTCNTYKQSPCTQLTLLLSTSACSCGFLLLRSLVALATKWHSAGMAQPWLLRQSGSSQTALRAAQCLWQSASPTKAGCITRHG